MPGAPRCVTGPLAVTVAGALPGGNYSQASIGGIPSGCNDLALNLTVFGSAGAALGTSATSAVAATGTTTVTMIAAYSGVAVLGAALTIGGYGVTTTWTGPPPLATCVVSQANGGGGGWRAPTTQTCSVTSTSVGTVQGSSPSRFATISIVIQNNSSDTIRWQVDANLAQLLNWSTNSITFPGGGGSSCTIVNSAVTLSGSNAGLGSLSSTTVNFDAFESPNASATCHV